MKFFVLSQSFAMMAGSVSFPFYLLFIRNIGSNFSSFGFAYGLFMLSSAVFHRWIGSVADKVGSRTLLIGYAWGMAFIFLFIPEADSLADVYGLQVILGLLGAVQKTCEKTMAGEVFHGKGAGKKIGGYHFWTSLFASFAVFASGVLIDFFTIDFIFYLASFLFAGSGLALLFYDKKREESVEMEERAG
ncbi:MFS transporter [Rossellomorea vietnamensis]|uniref:MFS transporter n=1 Tax=Rossellomorea vietnamensis TaxID=218284 RepID=A0A5D4MGT5_9BACI|nr:MFS transporter [Rossellomorea vietnamensis]TYS00221.1 MFS transporter [Rossellomorea vietnamensis]